MKFDTVGKTSNRILNLKRFPFRLANIKFDLSQAFRHFERCMTLIPLFNKLFNVFLIETKFSFQLFFRRQFFSRDPFV